MPLNDPADLPAPPDLGDALLGLLARHAAAGPAYPAHPALAEAAGDACPDAFVEAGDVVLLVGSLLDAEQGLARERAVEEVVRRAVGEGLLASVRACAGGGLAVALAACCVGRAPAGVGAAVRVPFPARKDLVLFGEAPGRVVVSLPLAGVERLEALARECGAPVVRLGAVGGDTLEIQAALAVQVADLARAWRGELPAEPA